MSTIPASRAGRAGVLRDAVAQAILAPSSHNTPPWAFRIDDSGISRARAKTDRLAARTLAKLLAAGELDAVWIPDERTRAMRRGLSRRSQLVRSRTRSKNETHAVLIGG